MNTKTYRIDPENIEPDTILKMAGPLTGKRVLEIGCGSGRLTWRYAQDAKEVIAIDPTEADITAAQRDNPYAHVHFITADILDYADPNSFDIVLLSWSL